MVAPRRAEPRATVLSLNEDLHVRRLIPRTNLYPVASLLSDARILRGGQRRPGEARADFRLD